VAWVRQLWQRPDSIQRIKIALSAQAHLNFTLQFDKTHIWHHSRLTGKMPVPQRMNFFWGVGVGHPAPKSLIENGATSQMKCLWGVPPARKIQRKKRGSLSHTA